MKATRHWMSNGVSFRNMSITHKITKDHIVCAITEMLDRNALYESYSEQEKERYRPKKIKINQQSVTKRIRFQLKNRGDNWVEYHGDEHFSDGIIIRAEKLGKQLFPSFWKNWKNQ